MASTAETNSTWLLQAQRGPLLFLIYTALVACGGGSSGGTTIATPVAPPTTRPPTTCSSSPTARDGTRYRDPIGAPRCLAHLFAEVDNLQGGGDIPSDARGVAFIYDNFHDIRERDAELDFFSENGFDGNGNYFLTISDHERLHGSVHGAEVRRVYNEFSPVSPAGVITNALRNRGTSGFPIIGRFYSGDQVRRAYTAARNDNPLITRAATSSPYKAHRAIYSISLSGSHELFYSISRDLSSLNAFEAKYNYAGIPTGLIGVGSLGNSRAEWNRGFRKEPTAFLVAGYFHDSLTDSTIAARIEDRDDAGFLDGLFWDSVEVNTDLTDLIASTPTTQLVELANHGSWRTPAGLVSSTFPDISGTRLGSIVSEAGQTRMSSGLSLLGLLAGATVHARTGHYYTASYLNRDGNGHYFDTHCGVLRDGCFILPYYASPNGWQGTSFAAPRLTAVIDTLWLVWPNLTNLSMHRLLSSCTFDLGASRS